MKRDWDLIRRILLWQECDDEQEKVRLEVAIDQEWSQPVVLEHTRLLIENRCPDGVVLGCHEIPDTVIVRRLTWQGHDLLAAMRDETVWKKVTGTVNRTVGGATVDVLKGLLESAMRAAAEAAMRTAGGS
ncbi:DUF2513 domain-containing protein [Opitutales bacterium ASA1]|uniref:DUF2513 domain-containing protein n=1 Tax=Congregicoccus parvus TaxID=3081749 RepID=UPI002B27FC7F|nr:DUF2513 domain-containing protein [Opitutales bacterium ASA1]